MTQTSYTLNRSSIRALLILAVTAYALTVQFSASTADSTALSFSCQGIKERVDGYFSKIIGTADRVENIPPDILNYLKQEENDAWEQGNYGRLGILMNHKYYAAWQVRTKMEEAKEYYASLNSNRSEKSLRALLNLKDAVNALVSRLQEYVDADQKRAKEVFAKSEVPVSNIAGINILLQGDINRFAVCK